MKAIIIERLLNLEEFVPVKNGTRVEKYNAVLQELENRGIKGMHITDLIKQMHASGKLELFIEEMDNIQCDILYAGSRVHGVTHNERVAMFAFTIGTLENLDDEDLRILLNAAKYHDIGRIDDDEDSEHGRKASEYFDEYQIGSDLKSESRKILKAICIGHSIPDENFEDVMEEMGIEDKIKCKKLFEILKDADGLDRARLRYSTIDSRYLRTDYAKMLMPAAYELYENYQYETNRYINERKQKYLEHINEKDTNESKLELVKKMKDSLGGRITVNGLNLNSTEGEFDLLSRNIYDSYSTLFQYFSHIYNRSLEEQCDYLDYFGESLLEIENVYMNVFQMLADTKDKHSRIKSMKIRDGKVILEPGMLMHKGSAIMETLKSISISGLLASEWFGIPESEAECPYCISISALQDDCRNANLGWKDRIQYYLDKDNPVMKALLQLDYFEYEYLKQTNPEKLTEMKNLTPRIRDAIEDVISTLSLDHNVHNSNPHDNRNYWRAIPGGIPPQLINGIAIHHENEEMLKHLEQIRKMFPNAVIFDEQQNVIAMPINMGNKKEKEQEGTEH